MPAATLSGSGSCARGTPDPNAHTTTSVVNVVNTTHWNDLICMSCPRSGWPPAPRLRWSRRSFTKAEAGHCYLLQRHGHVALGNVTDLHLGGFLHRRHIDDRDVV